MAEERTNRFDRLITNRNKLLSEIISDIMPSTESLSFLVGYFYFSGFEQLYRKIGENQPLRILVGMEAESTVTGALREISQRTFEEKARGSLSFGISREAHRDSWYTSLVDASNNTDLFDAPDRQESFRFFVQKIENGSLQIKKTLEENHAKLYLFSHNDAASRLTFSPGILITGSSNLTWSGLSNRSEVNVILREASDFTEGMQLFENLWGEAVPLVDASTKDLFFKRIKHTWMEYEATPYLMFVRVLDEYFNLKEEPVKLPSEITAGKYFSTAYQIDAIKKGLSTIHAHHGCLVADVVGLGKSIIGAAIAHNLGHRTLVICPPHLEKQWNDYLFDFSISGEVWTSGKIEEALKSAVSVHGKKTIIIDEAHRYRNENTLDYLLLHKLCAGNAVILLTATPFNNRPQDIFSLVKLFQIPGKASLQTTDNLAAEMETLIQDYNKLKINKGKEAETKEGQKCIASEIRRLLSPLVIRRTRLDLQSIRSYREDLEKHNIAFAQVHEPIELDYELGALGDLYTWTLDRISGENGYRGSRYKPLVYLKDDARQKYIEEFSGEANLLERGQDNLALFMRRLLVRRFESSVHSFKSTLNAMIASAENTMNWYEKFAAVPLFKRGKIPLTEDLEEALSDSLEALYDDCGDDRLTSVLSLEIKKGLILISTEDLRPEFLSDMSKDIELLKEIRDKWLGVERSSDSKYKAFENILRKAIEGDRDRKLVVFSEFADTVDYLAKGLEEAGLRVFSYSSRSSGKREKERIRMNFDAGASEKLDEFDVLIATDAISEGVNLHRAGSIYNYDIPYNPTRVIQRVGRINRINQKVFEELFIFNFFPSLTGEAISNIKGISTFKIKIIHSIMGSDAQILTSDEELSSYFTEEYRRMNAEDESTSWDAEYLDLITSMRQDEKETIKAARSIPRRSRIGRVSTDGGNSVLLFAKNGHEYRFTLAGKTENGSITTRVLAPEEALPLFRAAMAENGKALSGDFDTLYNKARTALEEASPLPPHSKVALAALERLSLLENRYESGPEAPYIARVRRVCEELSALPEGTLKEIKALNLRGEGALEELQKAVPVWYLDSIIARADGALKEKQQLILSEEFS